MKHVPRPGLVSELARLLRSFPAVAILGPRQAGKTTLMRDFLRSRSGAKSGAAVTFDLERGADFDRLSRAPEQDLGALQARRRFIAIDEIQRLPSVFASLRPLLDAPDRRARYLLLGSASPSLVRGVSESLAGRVGFLDLSPFLAAEVLAEEGRVRERHWARGGFPPSFLARSEAVSFDWRDGYVRALLERDIPALGLDLSAVSLRRLLRMVAHLHGGMLNMAEIASGLGVSGPTVLRYLDLLEGLFVVRRLPPYFANVGKRLTRAPKIYVRDTGLLHLLLGVADHDALLAHPKVGTSWEAWVIEQALGSLRLAGQKPEPFFWRTHGGAEVDLLVRLGSDLVPIEIKLGRPDRGSRGLVECMKDLEAARGFVLHSGSDFYPLGSSTFALPARLLADPKALLQALLKPERVRR